MADFRDLIEQFIAPAIIEQVNLQFQPYEVGWLQEYASRLGAVSDRPEMVYRAYAVPGDAINALAIPGGNVYVYEGLLSRFDRPIICGVLGHEIAHEAERHVMDATIAAYGVDLLTNMFRQGRGKELTDLVLKILWRGYGREKEFEADKLSIHYNLNADLWPYGIKYFLEWLVAQEQPDGYIEGLIESLLATHPPSSERLAKVEAELARLEIPEKPLIMEKLKSILPWLLGIGATATIVGLLIYFAKKK